MRNKNLENRIAGDRQSWQSCLLNNSVPKPQGRYSGFQVTGMIKWSQKSRPKKIPRASSKTQKNLVTVKPIDWIEAIEVSYTDGHHGTMQTIV